ncbi:hypothetical protein AB4K20DRAFT_1795556 [Rhizopus microsporus]|uniref:Uncharacterized protein n=1 Tax=Rhizopus microsporus TaxID=58291 RepID=A0A1X0RLU8_RHIZD|nr:hypothetical protein BCV71DRAFT_279586 [Rhizopus microsporus]
MTLACVRNILTIVCQKNQVHNGYECIGKLEDEICQVGHSVYKVQISLAYGYFIWFSLFLIKTKNIIDKDYRCEVEKMIGEDELKTILHQHNTAIYSEKSRIIRDDKQIAESFELKISTAIDFFIDQCQYQKINQQKLIFYWKHMLTILLRDIAVQQKASEAASYATKVQRAIFSKSKCHIIRKFTIQNIQNTTSWNDITFWK